MGQSQTNSDLSSREISFPDENKRPGIVSALKPTTTCLIGDRDLGKTPTIQLETQPGSCPIPA
jgi:hypothetical protein